MKDPLTPPRNRRESMPAYMVFTRERMRDEKEYEIYRRKNRVAMEGHPIKKDVLCGKYEVLEGAEVREL